MMLPSQELQSTLDDCSSEDHLLFLPRVQLAAVAEGLPANGQYIAKLQKKGAGTVTHMGKRIHISLGKERRGLIQRTQPAQRYPTSTIFFKTWAVVGGH